jgi:hypothetical protein
MQRRGTLWVLLNSYKFNWEVALSSGLGANPTKHSPSVSAMNPPLQVGLTFLSDELDSSDNEDTGIQPGDVVGHSRPAEVWEGQSIPCSERRASDLHPTDPHLILQLELPGRRDPSGGWPTIYSNPPVCGGVLCISDPI